MIVVVSGVYIVCEAACVGELREGEGSFISWLLFYFNVPSKLVVFAKLICDYISKAISRKNTPY